MKSYLYPLMDPPRQTIPRHDNSKCINQMAEDIIYVLRNTYGNAIKDHDDDLGISINSWVEKLSRGSIYSVVLYDSNECPVATASFSVYNDNLIKTRRLAVVESSRGQGLGKKIFNLREEAISSFASLNTTVESEVRACNPAAVSLFLKSGYTPTSIRPIRYTRSPENDKILEFFYTFTKSSNENGNANPNYEHYKGCMLSKDTNVLIQNNGVLAYLDTPKLDCIIPSDYCSGSYRFLGMHENRYIFGDLIPQKDLKYCYEIWSPDENYGKELNDKFQFFVEIYLDIVSHHNLIPKRAF